MKTSKKYPIAREPIARPLALDPTPAGLITQPLRKSFKYVWKCIRDEHFVHGDFSCDICNTVESKAKLIHAHEVYSFSSSQMVQLERVAFLCTRCHDVTHFERSQGRCKEPYLRTLIDHYCKVNGGISEDEFRQDITDTFRKMLAIRESYGGANATPPIHYGPFQERVNAFWERRRELSRGPDDDDDDSDFEMLQDHEFPWDTAMWRDCFG